ncbi:hypothetical protein [Alkalitalea saponilacus]|uniref:Uncharacterized protein n=1 Tax=Alkalitalea saponilacus TaxID=889453 RepID=A0A1T5HMW9_9BACT|nr:hypothetical protein [Alkalitalea saponilacus]ASB49374.1 hypothetical protein CDL62_09595 [Alkalitalea saponilacus]SKC22019.1 hypothetical protein SAMN03080601_02489 [Alkalitalea saponilacus]
MENITKFEKIIISVTLGFGLFGGVLLVFLNFPPIVPSLLIAMAISTLVFYFLGGIENSNFNMGPVKLSGSIAALIGSAFIINWQLSEQQINENNQLMLGNNLTVYSPSGNAMGRLDVSGFRLTSNNRLMANDTVYVGRLNLDLKGLDNNFSVMASDSLVLGSILKNNLEELSLFNDLRLERYMEVTYDLQINPVFTASIGFGESQLFYDQYKAHYEDLPFYVEPMNITGRERGNGIRTVVGVKGNPNESKKDFPLTSGESFLVDDFNEKVYFVRTRGANIGLVNRPMFVQYQILEFSRRVK